jgi:ribosomal protein S18 acetylase RimI-like enzyme
MSDLLVRLYSLPPQETAPSGFSIRRALTPEQSIVLRWVTEHFSSAWADECAAAFARQPVACFLALEGDALCGFAAYEATCRNFLGPLGVAEYSRGRGLGRALLLASLHALHAEGYAYAIIGDAGPKLFFEKSVGAVEIEGSSPGLYRGMLRG